MNISDYGAYVRCPFCNYALEEGTAYCECEEGEVYIYKGTSYIVQRLSPWYVYTKYGRNDNGCLDTECCGSYTPVALETSAEGGPQVSIFYEKENRLSRIRIPNKWNSKTGRDDLRKSWGTKPGGLKNSLLRARGSFRK